MKNPLLFAAGIFIEKGKSDPCHTGLPGGFGDGLGHGGAYPLVEGGGDDVVCAELLRGDQIGQSLGGGHLHLLIDVGGTHIEGSPKDAGEGQDIVDLVGVIAAAGTTLAYRTKETIRL